MKKSIIKKPRQNVHESVLVKQIHNAVFSFVNDLDEVETLSLTTVKSFPVKEKHWWDELEPLDDIHEMMKNDIDIRDSKHLQPKVEDNNNKS